MKPQLPKEIAAKFPQEIIHHIMTFVPHLVPPKPKASPSFSPHAERDLRMIQNVILRGKSAMYMRELDDFVLD